MGGAGLSAEREFERMDGERERERERVERFVWTCDVVSVDVCCVSVHVNV